MKLAPCLYGTRQFRVIRQTELPDLRKLLKIQSLLVSSCLQKCVKNIMEAANLFHPDRQRRNAKLISNEMERRHSCVMDLVQAKQNLMVKCLMILMEFYPAADAILSQKPI